MGRLIFLTYFYLIASLIHIVLIGLIQFRCTKLAKIFEYQIFLFVFYSLVSQMYQWIDLILSDSQPLTIFQI